MKIDLEALRATAAAAVLGPYTMIPRPSQGFVEILHHSDLPGAPSEIVARVTVRTSWAQAQTATAHMFSMLDPETVLELISRLQRAESQLADLRRIYNEEAEAAGWCP